MISDNSGDRQNGWNSFMEFCLGCLSFYICAGLELHLPIDKVNCNCYSDSIETVNNINTDKNSGTSGYQIRKDDEVCQ